MVSRATRRGVMFLTGSVHDLKTHARLWLSRRELGHVQYGLNAPGTSLYVHWRHVACVRTLVRAKKVCRPRSLPLCDLSRFIKRQLGDMCFGNICPCEQSR